jgi:4-hydroxy-tetrahydrodipicolinate reductase
MIKILICGAQGRMGKEAVNAIQEDSELELVGVCLRGDNLSDKINSHKPDVVLDLTTPDAVYQNCETIIAHNVRPVIGTTGLTSEQIEHIQQLCLQKQLGGIIAPNFSLSVMLMIKMAALAAQYFPQAEIIELHHDKKKDSPSGTAIKTAQIIAQNRAHNNIDVPYPNEPARGSIHEQIPIHSVRLPGLIAHQQIIFGGYYESLEIKQDNFDRKSFMPGVLMACKKVIKLQNLVYGLENLL